MGILNDEASVYEKFIQQISFEGQRYQVSLQLRECHPPLLDNLDQCRGWLFSLLKRLKQNRKLLADYDSVIKDQINRGIVQVVINPALTDTDRIHYQPHHCVVRWDKATSKLMIVYNASARAIGPSLNDCLHTGSKIGQPIFDILL